MPPTPTVGADPATLGQVVTSAMSGYAFARFRFPGRELFFYLTLTGLMIPFVTVMVPVVQLVNDFHWLNTYQGLIVPNVQSAFGMFLFRQCFLSLPTDVEDAATVDGASLVRRFAAIALPMARPIISGFALLAFLVNWNNFLYPLLVTKTQNIMVVPLGLLPVPVHDLLQPSDGGRTHRRRPRPDRVDLCPARHRQRDHPGLVPVALVAPSEGGQCLLRSLARRPLRHAREGGNAACTRSQGRLAGGLAAIHGPTYEVPDDRDDRHDERDVDELAEVNQHEEDEPEHQQRNADV